MPLSYDQHLLFVDDEQDTLFALKRYLRNEPYTAHFARNADEALRFCEQHNISVVVTDLRMPGVSGLQLIENLQQQYPDTVRIILSGTEDIGMVIETINSGRIFRFIPKPMDPESLKTILEDALAYYRLQLEHKEMTQLADKQNRYLTRINDELRQMTARLRESEVRFRAMNDAAFDPIFLVDTDGAVVYANTAAETLFGFTKAEFQSMPFRRLIAPEESGKSREALFASEQEESLQERQIDCLKKDGTPINIGISTGTVSIQTIPHTVVIARDNTLRIQEENSRRELEKVQQTLESQIERRLLQSHAPRDLEGASISHFTFSSGHLNGDFSDFIGYDSRHADILQGDVMGHGILSALVGSGIKSLYLRTIARKSFGGKVPGLGEIVAALHEECIRDLIEIEIYSTMLFFRLDLEKRLVSMVDCGHTATLHVHASSGTCSRLKGNNMPIGMVEEQEFHTTTTEIEEGDIIVIYSDGITEARLPDGSFFGEERLMEIVMAERHTGTKNISDRIRGELVSVTGSDSFEDDTSCIVIRIGEGDA